MGSALRWAARTGSVLSLLFLLLIVSGELFGGGQAARPTSREWLGLAFFPIGVGLGLALAWFRERLGGAVAIASLIAFYVWNLIESGGRLPGGPFFILVAAPAFLFLAAALCSRPRSAGKS